MADTFETFHHDVSSPPQHLFAITPNDGADLATAVRALNVSAAGTVRVTTVGGDTETIYVAAGGAFPVRAIRVWSTGTTATGIVGMY